ncbi:MAG TPA: S8 family serine peptidase [Candidatus Thermoplasmatota archaeon]|nr:S8 family serine peptidase [Candidatus Thermoplasmatota archaeon]
MSVQARAATLVLVALMLAGSMPVAGAGAEVRTPLLLVGVGDLALDEAEKRVRLMGGTVVERIPQIGLIAVDEGRATDLAARLDAAPWTDYVGRDGLARALDLNAMTPNPPADPLYHRQWGPAVANFTGAWRSEQGQEGVIVAVLDSGVFVQHPDLVEACARHCGLGNVDGYGHGTHVAGIIAAAANNGEGIAGVAPGVSIMSIKVLTDAGVGPWLTIIQGVVMAADAGARVISMSLGGQCDAGTCEALREAGRYAASRDALLVAAAGNAGCAPCVAYPAALPEYMAVAASRGPHGDFAWFSSRGPELEISAPGEAVVSAMAPASVLGGVCLLDGYVSPHYCALDGTSMAAPHVSGAAALIMSRCPHVPAADVRAVLVSTAKDRGPKGHDWIYGHGSLDAGRALAAAC